MSKFVTVAADIGFNVGISYVFTQPVWESAAPSEAAWKLHDAGVLPIAAVRVPGYPDIQS
jgi:hypothetical protein